MTPNRRQKLTNAIFATRKLRDLIKQKLALLDQLERALILERDKPEATNF